MDRTVCELFAGIGGFRLGLNGSTDNDKWRTVWFNQWEPADKRIQYAYGCYMQRFGGPDIPNGNTDIEAVDKSDIPDFSLLVGGFPCQNYSVAASSDKAKGIEGEKGVLWWSIDDVIRAKHPPFILLENVDRLLKSPAGQRGRDFGIILSCLARESYITEWRIINAADYGYPQRRRRVFIFACREDTEYTEKIKKQTALQVLTQSGFFISAFPAEADGNMKETVFGYDDIVSVSDTFSFPFENAGLCSGGIIYTVRMDPAYSGAHMVLGDILETEPVDKSLFIPKERLYYTNPSVTGCDETDGRLPAEARNTWQYLKGSKKYPRRSKNGFEYMYSEGSMPMIDEWDRPARTLLTSEGSFSRMTHLVRDKTTGGIRLLTPEETERIQGFPSGFTAKCLTDDGIIDVPDRKRKFLIGNALEVGLISDMGKVLNRIFDAER